MNVSTYEVKNLSGFVIIIGRMVLHRRRKMVSYITAGGVSFAPSTLERSS